MALPKVVYVYEENERDGSSYLCATHDPDGLSGVVGVYEIREKMQARQKTQFKREGTKTWFDKA